VAAANALLSVFSLTSLDPLGAVIGEVLVRAYSLQDARDVAADAMLFEG
jgi:hypothetical protein